MAVTFILLGDHHFVRTTLPHSLLALYLRMEERTPTPPPAAAMPIAVVAVLALPKVAISAGAATSSDAAPTGAPVYTILNL